MTIPALEAAGQSHWRRWRTKQQAKQATRQPSITRPAEPLDAADKAFFAVFFSTILIFITLTVFLIAHAHSQWEGIEEHVAAVAIQDSRLTEDQGQVTKVEYEYNGSQRTDVVQSPGDVMAGDTMEISISKETGEPITQWPDPVLFLIVTSLFLSLGYAAICAVICLILFGIFSKD